MPTSERTFQKVSQQHKQKVTHHLEVNGVGWARKEVGAIFAGNSSSKVAFQLVTGLFVSNITKMLHRGEVSPQQDQEN